MDDNPRARLWVLTQYYALLGGLCLLGGVALLLYAYLNPAPPPLAGHVGIGWSGTAVAGLCGIAFTIFGAVSVGVLVLSAVLAARR
jgi:hypothetical protein